MNPRPGAPEATLAVPAVGEEAAPRPARWRRLWELLRESLRPPSPQPLHPDWFSAAELASYHRAMLRTAAGAEVIDDATWSDLQVDAWLRQLAGETSLCGRQLLLQRLRSGCAEPARSQAAKVAHDPATAALLAAAAPAREQLRCVRLDLVPALFDEALPRLPAWAGRLWLVPLLLTAGVGVALGLSPLAGALVLLAWAAVSAFFVARLSAPLRHWREIRESLCMLLAAGQALAAVARRAPPPWLAGLVEIETKLQRQWRRLTPNALERLPGVPEYLNLVGLYDYTRMRRQLAALRADLPTLRDCYERIAAADAELALARHLRNTPGWCLAECGAARQLRLQALVHPLLAQAQPLTVQLDDHGLLITGHNGVGKSTLLRAVGLSLMGARAFGFCYAQAATVPDRPPMTSIENHDNLQTADSLYMAELRRAAAMLATARSGGGAVFLIDELFRGTNPVESVSAAAAVLATLARHSLVLASTHHGVLAPLLRGPLRPMCVVRQAGPQHSVALEPGVLVDPNGIEMMRQHALPSEVVESARRIAAWLAKHDAQAQDLPEWPDER